MKKINKFIYTKMSGLISFFLISSSLLCFGQPSAKTIIERIDKNMSSENRIFTSKMIVHGRRGSRTIESKTWAVGEKKAFTEYLSPAREAGTKMLKLEDQLWIYSPSSDRTIQISGHMLRQSLMGSDLSYEDMMEDASLTEKYDAVVIGSEPLNTNDCWILQLTARVEDVSYQTRKIWVDKEKYIPLKEELYAKSGQLLKKFEIQEWEKIDERWFPTKMVYKDMLNSGDGTVFIIDEINFDQQIPEYIFTKASLR